MAEENAAKTNIQIPPEMVEKLVEGEITIAELVGLSRGTLYAIAEVGYQMLTSGKVEQAKQIYQGLAAADPYDSVFHCHLAAAHHKLGELDEALAEYSKALQFNFANIDALAGRGEIYFNKGQLTEAFNDLKEAIERDPEAKYPSTARARAIMMALKEVVESHQNESQ